MNATSPRVGMFPPPDLLDWDPATARAFLDQVAAAGIDHVCCGDHVSFFAGLGFDGLLQATALAMLHPSLPIYMRRCTCCRCAIQSWWPASSPTSTGSRPGGSSSGSGIGGEDRHEVAICGVDPATRGARMDECLDRAAPAPDRHRRSPSTASSSTWTRRVIAPAPPGRSRSSSAAARTRRSGGRAGSATAGWASGTRRAGSPPPSSWRPRRPPAPAGPSPPTRHAMQVWCGLADSREAARACLAPAMEAFYQLPFERFERYCPYGTADDVAEFLAPYVAGGLHRVQPDPAVARPASGRRRGGRRAEPAGREPVPPRLHQVLPH